jgi:Flp pilus assembly protein TadD
MWESTAVAVLGLGCAAVAASAATARRARVALPLRLALVPVALVAIAVQVPGLLITLDVRHSQQAFARGDYATAQRDAQDASDIGSWAATPLVQLGLLAEHRRNLHEAATRLRDASAADPYDWRPHLLLARVYAEAGDARRSLAEFNAARRLRPGSPFLRPVPIPRPARRSQSGP